MSDEGGESGLCADRLRELLHAAGALGQVIVLPDTTSTNDELRVRAAGGAEQGTIVVADRQSAGRGRRGRVWHSPSGLGLYLSMLFRPTGPLEHITRWTLAAAVAACHACREVSGASVAIEWPNDLVGPDSRKLGGILAELRAGHGGGRELILGTGLNVSHRETDFPPTLRGCATSLALMGGGAVDRERLAAHFVIEMRKLGDRLEAGDWDPIRRRWYELAVGAFGRQVRIRRDTGSTALRGFYDGITDGLDESGALLVRLEGGGVEAARMTDSVEPGETRSCF